MRRRLVVVVWLLLLAACSTGTSEGTSEGATDRSAGRPSPSGRLPGAVDTTTVGSTTVTVPPGTSPVTSRAEDPATTMPVPAKRPVTLHLDPVEALAASTGITVEVTFGGVVLGALGAESPTLTVDLPSGDGFAELGFMYVTEDGEDTDVVWSQSANPSSGELTVVQPWREPSPVDRTGAVILAWQTEGDNGVAAAELDAAVPLTAVSPMTWFVAGDGTIAGDLTTATVRRGVDRGLAVWPAVQGIDVNVLHEFLSDPERRRAAVDTIAADAEAAGADGVNVDIEGFRNGDAAGLTAFVAELGEAVSRWGGVVSYDLVPRSDTWEVTPAELSYWSTAPERRKLAAVAGYTILMSYDQHNRFRPTGPVAAVDWVEETIVYALRYADPHRLILGIPGYGRIWGPTELDAPRAVPLAVLPDGEAAFDDEHGMDRVTLPDGRFYWDERQVVGQRLALADAYGLAGIALWRLGFDDANLWEQIDSRWPTNR